MALTKEQLAKLANLEPHTHSQLWANFDSAEGANGFARYLQVTYDVETRVVLAHHHGDLWKYEVWTDSVYPTVGDCPDCQWYNRQPQTLA